MFLERIKSHNYINGFTFSAVEFLFAALVIAPFGIYYVTHGKVFNACIAGGLVLNFLTIVFFAVNSSFKGEKSLGLSFYLNREKRKEVARTYPHLTTDTFILCIGMLIPFCLFVFSIIESLI